MKLTEQNYELELNEDIEQLKLQKEELEKLRKILGEFPFPIICVFPYNRY